MQVFNHDLASMGKSVKKVLGPATDFPTWRSGKRTENRQGIWLWKPLGFDYRTYIGLGKQTLRGHKQNFVCTDTNRREEQWSHRRLTQTRLWVSRSLWWVSGLIVACCSIGDTEYKSAGTWPLEGGHHCLHYRYHCLVSCQMSNKWSGHSPVHPQKIGLNSYSAWFHISEQVPDSLCCCC